MTQINHFSDAANVEKARIALCKQGVYFVENVYDQAFCQTAIDFMDTWKEASDAPAEFKMEMQYGGSELRIWHAQQKNPLLQQFFHECNDTMSRLTRNNEKAYTLLAIRNKMIDVSNQKLKQGRWHIDSLFKQLKIFLFLTDTTEKSGPFEFIPRTHANPFKFKMLLSGKYVKPSDLLKRGKRAYQQLDDNIIDKLGHRGYAPLPAICKAGTIMVVNTSAIHRARPCIEGARYALTAYYR